MTPSQKIQALVAELIQYNCEYYILDEPSVSDAVYDKKYKELKELEALHPKLVMPSSPTQNVGHPVVANHFALMKHRFPMLSLDNSLTVDELIDWTIDITDDPKHSDELRIEWKMDGLSLDLIYFKGRLMYALTRGDGYIGENVTLNALNVESIPKELSGTYDQDWISVRGEIVVDLAHYRKLNAELEALGKKVYANPRNYAAGALRQKDPSVTGERGLVFYAYSVTSEPSVHDHWSKERQFMLMNGFKTAYTEEKFNYNPESLAHTKIPETVNRLQARRSQLPFEVDGLVIKVMSHATRERLGYTSKFPRWATAYKFPATEGYTKLLDIEYQIGRTGQATPVARLDPVLVHGTTISNVTLHNRTQIERLNLYVGCQVIVKRAGDVIPKIVGTVKPRVDEELYKPLENCPCCGTKTYVVKGDQGEQDYCPNRKCPDRLLAYLNYCTERKVLNIKGLGPAVVQTLLYKGLCHPTHGLALLDLTADDFIKAGESEHQANKLAEAINVAREGLTLERAIMALGISNVAEGGSVRLARRFGTIAKLAEASMDELVAVPDVGPITAQSIFEYFDEERDDIKQLKSLGSWEPYIQGLNLPAPEPIVASLEWSGSSVVVTGSKFGGMSRKEMENLYKQMGASIAKDVSSTTKLVLCGTKYTPRKLNTAKTQGIHYKVFDEHSVIEEGNVVENIPSSVGEV